MPEWAVANIGGTKRKRGLKKATQVIENKAFIVDRIQ